MRPRDTTAEAEAVQTAIYRRMTPARRCELGIQLSIHAREIMLGGIRSRHPEYDVREARWALFRLLLGDELFRRAWPRAPLLSP